MTTPRDVVVYVPAEGHPTTGSIARGSAIVGVPEPGADDVRIYFEGAIYGQVNLITLADRAVCAYGRLRERYPTLARRTVPREALVAVGTFDQAGGRIVLTGERSASAVADWLGLPSLDPAELRRSGPEPLHRGPR
jgi:hypothetical protein